MRAARELSRLYRRARSAARDESGSVNTQRWVAFKHQSIHSLKHRSRRAHLKLKPSTPPAHIMQNETDANVSCLNINEYTRRAAPPNIRTRSVIKEIQKTFFDRALKRASSRRFRVTIRRTLILIVSRVKAWIT
jgi:hypothetical protein